MNPAAAPPSSSFSSRAESAPRLLLVCAVWLALAGAAFANQMAILGLASGEVISAVSVALWLLQPVAAGLIIFFLSENAALEQRLGWTLRIVAPLALALWIGVAAALPLGMISPAAFIGLHMTVVAVLPVWRGHGIAVWLASFGMAALAIMTLLRPQDAAFAAAAACVWCVAIGWISSTAK
ncbi:MAG: hypothetical protein WCK47_07600 [bacterium]